MTEEEFLEMMHSNWATQMDMNGYNADGTQKCEEGYFTPKEQTQYTHAINKLYKPIGINVYKVCRGSNND